MTAVGNEEPWKIWAINNHKEKGKRDGGKEAEGDEGRGGGIGGSDLRSHRWDLHLASLKQTGADLFLF